MSFVGSIGEIYNEQDIDSLIQIQGEVNEVFIADNDLYWDGDAVSDTYNTLPNSEVYTQGIYLVGDVGGADRDNNYVTLQNNVFNTDIVSTSHAVVHWLCAS